MVRRVKGLFWDNVIEPNFSYRLALICLCCIFKTDVNAHQAPLPLPRTGPDAHIAEDQVALKNHAYVLLSWQISSLFSAQRCSNPSNGGRFNRLELSKVLICHCPDTYPLWNWYPHNKEPSVRECVCVCVCYLIRKAAHFLFTRRSGCKTY